MGKKVLILSGSPRKGGNSDLLCDEFGRGAESGGNTVEKIRIAEKKIGFCNACYYCRTHGGECAVKDDMAEVLQKMIEADVIVMASPVYFYSVDAQMKALIDRCLARAGELGGKEFYYIMTAAENDIAAMACTLSCFRGFADCLYHSKEGGVLYGVGVYEKGKVADTPLMSEAFRLGLRI